MNGYKAFYKGKTIEVYANTSLQARDEAAKKFKASKPYQVTVVLCETNASKDCPGVQVTHTPSL